MTLLYDAADIDFADRAVTALRAAGIPCFRVGGGMTICAYGEDHLTGRPTNDAKGDGPEAAEDDEPDASEFVDSADDLKARSQEAETAPYLSRGSSRYCIYIDRDEDYAKATGILLKMGAAKELMLSDDLIRAINKWTWVFAICAAIFIAAYVVENWR